MVPITCSSRSPGNRLLIWMYFNNVECNGLWWHCRLIDWFRPLCTAQVWLPLHMSFLGWRFNDRLRPDFASQCESLQWSAVITADADCAVYLVRTYDISSPHMHCSSALKQSQGDPNRCWMVVLSWVHRGLFSLKVISSRSHITTRFDVTAYSCGSQISEIRSSVDI